VLCIYPTTSQYKFYLKLFVYRLDFLNDTSIQILSQIVRLSPRFFKRYLPLNDTHNTSIQILPQIICLLPRNVMQNNSPRFNLPEETRRPFLVLTPRSLVNYTIDRNSNAELNGPKFKITVQHTVSRYKIIEIRSKLFFAVENGKRTKYKISVQHTVTECKLIEIKCKLLFALENVKRTFNVYE
jgi:hypothetical protein